MDAGDILKPVRGDIKAVEAVIRDSMPKDFMPDYLGKSLRSGIFLLCSKSAEYDINNADLHKIAASLEMMHLASLIHDDICDNSSMRRGYATLNSEYGTAYAVVAGDLVLSKASRLLADSNGDNLLFSKFSLMLERMSQGQLRQIGSRGCGNLERGDYLKIIELKTASLFSASSEAGAWHQGLEDSNLASFGHHFGMAYQMVDDYKDLDSKGYFDKDRMQNITNGEYTLPLIIIREKTGLGYQSICADFGLHMVENDILPDIRTIVEKHIKKASTSMDYLGENQYTHSLLGLLDYLMNQLSD